MIEIQNDGPRIANTNYWQSEYALNGYPVPEWNAGVGRLLLPPTIKGIGPREKFIDVINATVAYVIVSKGKWQAYDSDAYELLFEDHTNSPYSITITDKQTDRILTDDGKPFDIAIWTERGERLKKPGKYRIVDTLPCGKPWSEA